MAGRKDASHKSAAALGFTRSHNHRVSKKSKASAKSIKHKDSLLAEDLDAILMSEVLPTGKKTGKKLELAEPGKDMEVDSAEEKKEKKSGDVLDLLDRLGEL